MSEASGYKKIGAEYVRNGFSNGLDPKKESRKLRKHSREICSINVKYSAADDATVEDCIRNISASGVFIETDRLFAIGQEVVLNFTLPRYPNPLNFKGEVVRLDDNGIAVRFKRLAESP